MLLSMGLAWAGPAPAPAAEAEGEGEPSVGSLLAETPGAARIEGLVTFAGEALPGIEITLDGDSLHRTTTGPEGTFVIPTGAGSFRVQIGAVEGGVRPVDVTVAGDAPLGIRVEMSSETGEPTVTLVPGRPVGPGEARLWGHLRSESGQALAGARVFVSGVSATATTDADGRYELALRPGKWGLIAVAPGFTTRSTVADAVAGGGPGADTAAGLPVDFVMPAAAGSLGPPGAELSQRVDVVASSIQDGGAAMLLERKNAVAVTDGIAAGQITRTGDADAAGAARRVTGLTVIDGKYVYVRGLGERYSATTLNGSNLPSPEPERRVVPLDLFPTPLLDSLLIQKTWTPDLAGEFSGGVVQIRTRRLPEAPLLALSVSGTWVSGATFTTVEQGFRGPTDWLGFGLGERALPSAIADSDGALKVAGRFSDGGYSSEDLAGFGELLPNRWGITERMALPDLGFNLAIGNRVDLGGARLGGLLGLAFKNSWGVDDGFENVYSAGTDGMVLSRETVFRETSNTVRLGGMGSLGVDWGSAGDHLGSVTLLNRDSEATVTMWDATEPSATGGSRNTAIDWEEQQLFSEQVEAQLTLGPVQVLPRYTLAAARRDAPDHRDSTYTQTDAGYAVSTIGSWNELRWEQLSEVGHDGGLTLRYPLRLPGGDGALAVGGQASTRHREAGTRRFAYGFRGTDGLDLTVPMEDLIVPENIGDDGDGSYLELEEGTANTDDYVASARVLAAFLMADLPVTARFRTMAGVRLEQSMQSVTTYEIYDPDLPAVVSGLSTLDPLPAASVTLGVGPARSPSAMQVRAGYSRTLSRPELRELSEVPYYEYRTGRLVLGNPELQRAVIHNVDMRWEWYPTEGESLSLAVFGKQFEHPIESVIAVSAVSGTVSTLANAQGATNLGAEIDGRKELPWGFYASGNLAVIASRVDLEGTAGNQTSTVRPLQGQSPYVANLLLGWEHAATHTTVTGVYNVFGPRIVAVGTSGIPDTYELPVHRVDLVLALGLGDHMSLRLTGRNLLAAPARQRVGDNIASEVREGVSVGISIGGTL